MISAYRKSKMCSSLFILFHVAKYRVILTENALTLLGSIGKCGSAKPPIDPSP